MKHFITTVLVITISITSCTKDHSISLDTLTSQSFTDADIQSGTRELNEAEHSGPSPSIATTGGLVCSYNPVPGTWYISTTYSNQYSHFYQIDAKPEYPGSVLCGPTSYMLAAHMICASKGIGFPSSKTKLGAMYNALFNAGKFDNTQGMYISDIDWFNSTYDYPTVKTNYRRTSDRSNMKEFIEYYIKSGFPVIATVNIYGTKGTYWGNDVDMYDQTGTQYYMSKKGPVVTSSSLSALK
jgi:hypothetical protein